MPSPSLRPLGRRNTGGFWKWLLPLLGFLLAGPILYHADVVTALTTMRVTANADPTRVVAGQPVTYSVSIEYDGSDSIQDLSIITATLANT